MDNLTAHLTPGSHRLRDLVARRDALRLYVMAGTGKPAIAPAWWGNLPAFSPNPDLK
jgi:hypothetical protein